MKRLVSRIRVERLLVLALVGLLSACLGTVTEPPPTDDLVVGGLVVQSNGVNVASVLGTRVTGELQGQEGVTSGLLAVFFVDDKGVQFTPFDNESMEVSIADESIATFAQVGTFTGRMSSLVAGNTTATFRFLQDGTAVYTSAPVPVLVVGPN